MPSFVSRRETVAFVRALPATEDAARNPVTPSTAVSVSATAMAPLRCLTSCIAPSPFSPVLRDEHGVGFGASRAGEEQAQASIHAGRARTTALPLSRVGLRTDKFRPL